MLGPGAAGVTRSREALAASEPPRQAPCPVPVSVASGGRGRAVKLQILVGHLGSQGSHTDCGDPGVVAAHLTILCHGEKRGTSWAGAGGGARGGGERL